MYEFPTNPILITGSHRSGTTWVGKMISLSWYIFYLEEPFNRCYDYISNDVLPQQFYYIRPQAKTSTLKATMDEILALSKPFNNLEFRYKLNRKIPLFKYTRQLLGLPRPLLKDPIAVFSSPWLAQTYNMSVICLVRHPAAFVMSLIKAEWPVEFDCLLAQPNLMEDYLHPFKHQMENPPDSFVERAALLWTIIYYVLSMYIDRYEKWLVMRLEDIAYNPLMEFPNLFKFLGIPYSKRIENVIKNYSQGDNPIEARQGKTWEIKRNSIAAQSVWQKHLKLEEIKAIRHITESVSSRFYQDVDWEIK